MIQREPHILGIEVQDILRGDGFYGSCAIEDRLLGYLPYPGRIEDGDVWQEVRWVGREGSSSSAGQAIRLLGKAWSVEIPVKRVLVGEGDGHHLVYFVISAEMPSNYVIDPPKPDVPHDGRIRHQRIYIVGGCTDFSGEGNHARQLMERFLGGRFGRLSDVNGQYLIGILASMDRLGRGHG